MAKKKQQISNLIIKFKIRKKFKLQKKKQNIFSSIFVYLNKISRFIGKFSGVTDKSIQ